MAEYTMADLFEDVTIDLGDAKFRVRQRTRSLGEQADGGEEKYRQLASDENATQDDVAEALIAILDVVLEPLGDGSENGTRKHAKTVLSKAWKENRIGLDRLVGLVAFCQDKMVRDADPTSRLTSDV